MDEPTREALEWLANPEDQWAATVTIAHLRVPRIEMMAYDDLAEAYHFEVKLVLDKAMTAFTATTWPGHEGGPNYVSSN